MSSRAWTIESAPGGQRLTHSPHRMQRSSSRSSTDCCSVPAPTWSARAIVMQFGRAHVDAQSAEDAELGREHDVVEAAQAAQPFEARLVLVVADLDLTEADPSVGRRRRDRLARDRVVVAVETAEAGAELDADLVFGARRGASFPSARAWIEAAARRPSAIASIRLRGPVRDVAAGPDPRVRGPQRGRVDLDAARARSLEPVAEEATGRPPGRPRG